ncbi:MAG: hypothetical protein ACRDYA_03760 [Egibacteraceae bacterium]
MAFLTTFGLDTGMGGAGSPVEFKDTANLNAQGAAIFVPVEVTCQEDEGPVFLGIQITQRTGDELASGSGTVGQDLACDGKPHTVEVFVQAQGRPFHPGVAAARADLTECDIEETSCRNETDIADITIR